MRFVEPVEKTVASPDRSKVVVALSGSSLDWRDFENGDVAGTAAAATATLTKERVVALPDVHRAPAVP